MEVYDVERYGLHMRKEQGWIAELGEDSYYHKFGGSSWKLSSSEREVRNDPTLLVTLDLTDPRLIELSNFPASELPLVSCINSNAWEKRQVFQIDSDHREVKMVQLEVSTLTYLDYEDQLPNPLPERRLKLREMREEEYPIDEETYWSACDEFIGGNAFIRILGPPIWLQWVEKETCSCGAAMRYICSIGYEDYTKPSGIISGKHFFIGEGALYFFLCSSCSKIVVISQSS